MNSLQYTYSVHANLSQLLKVLSRLKSTQVDMPLSSQVKSSRMCSSRPPSTWGSFPPQVWSSFCISATPRSRCYRWGRQLFGAAVKHAISGTYMVPAKGSQGGGRILYINSRPS